MEAAGASLVISKQQAVVAITLQTILSTPVHTAAVIVTLTRLMGIQCLKVTYGSMCM